MSINSTPKSIHSKIHVDQLKIFDANHSGVGNSICSFRALSFWWSKNWNKNHIKMLMCVVGGERARAREWAFLFFLIKCAIWISFEHDSKNFFQNIFAFSTFIHNFKRSRCEASKWRKQFRWQHWKHCRLKISRASAAKLRWQHYNDIRNMSTRIFYWNWLCNKVREEREKNRKNKQIDFLK